MREGRHGGRNERREERQFFGDLKVLELTQKSMGKISLPKVNTNLGGWVQQAGNSPPEKIHGLPFFFFFLKF